MVHGEYYKEYPGPLVKYFISQGLDSEHPGIFFELNHVVEREAPFWYGQCEGWSAAAVLYPFPEIRKVKGVHFFSPELKAILSTLRKDNTISLLAGSYDPGYMSPGELLSTLYNTIAKDKPVIFDIDKGEEHWNYPVAGFSLDTTEENGITHYKLDVTYVSPMLMEFQVNENQFFTVNYTFTRDSSGNYTWTSVNKPDIAWLPLAPNYPGTWYSTGNRYLNLEQYDHLMNESSTGSEDVYEPNNSFTTATKIDFQPLLGCIAENDTDYFSINLKENERFQVAVEAIGAQILVISILSSDSRLMQEHRIEGVAEIVFDAPRADEFFIELKSDDQQGDLFYQLVFEENNGFYNFHNLRALNDQTWQVKGLNLGTQNAQVNMLDLPANGSLVYAAGSEVPRTLSSYGPRMGWMSEYHVAPFDHREYHFDHPKTTKYRIPHVTFKNGWDTVLYISIDTTSPSVGTKVWTQDGTMLKNLQLPLTNGVFHGSLSKVLGYSGSKIVSHMEILAPPFHQVDGFYEYSRKEVGDMIRLPLRGAPVFAEFFVSDLCPNGKGWTGLSLVNVSDISNEIMYRHFDQDGVLLESGMFTLKPNEKKLTTVEAMTESELDDGHFIHFFSQYEIEGLVLQNRFGSSPISYGYKPYATSLDYYQNTWLAISYAERENYYLLIDNQSGQYQHLLFEAYSSQGELLGRYNVTLGEAISPYQSIRVPLSQIFENGFTYKDINLCSHVKVSLPEDIYIREQKVQNEYRLTTRPVGINPAMDYSGAAMKDAVQYDLSEM
ncbi:MAG: hypothetical protein CSA81_07630 [Acidobacteria bacterium]|nr:MAG: hypothetical protein CSA81_07630 [Acidobacteriota bacterium]